jgi:acetoin utilization deacetylase AcuC-like enzyme
MIAVVHHPDYVIAPTAKNALVRDLLVEMRGAIDWHVPEPAPREAIEAVHDPAYAAEVIEARVPRDKERRIGFAITPDIARRAVAVPGGTILAARLALERGFSANAAGGSHHALADTGAGYCVFNDLAIAAVRMAAAGHRVLVVDCDVHQGDGTAALLAGRADVATYSIHAEKNFPVRKARSTLDVPLADGVGDEGYKAALMQSLPQFLDRFAPDLVLYQAGVDPWEGDRLGRLSLTRDGLIARDRWIGALMRDRDLPIASTLGGGYGADPHEVAARHVASILALAEGRLGYAPSGQAAAAGLWPVPMSIVRDPCRLSREQ